MAEQCVQVVQQEPAFITYLLSPDLDHDCYFVVGNAVVGQSERIGVVKKMLLAHSVVLRAELQDSKMAEKGDVKVQDLCPVTFKNLLKFVYGYDTVSELCFDEADNLLYAAEKYLMEGLKAKLSLRLMDLLTADNVCSLLNNPACFTPLNLNSAITEILQYETDRVLASPQFVNLSSKAFVKILEQDGANVPEIELWRAALKWAKHNAGSEDGKVLREQLSEHTKHLRVCTLNHTDFFREVVTKDVLTDVELKFVNIAFGSLEKQAGLVDICNEIVPRILTYPKGVANFTTHSSTCNSQQASFMILTKKCSIDLFPMVFRANPQTSSQVPEDLRYQCDSTIQISRITDYSNDTSTETPVTVQFSQMVEFGKDFAIPVTSNGDKVTLLPNNKYTITVTFTQPHKMYYYSQTSLLDNEHFSLSVFYDSGSQRYYNTCRYLSPVKELYYRPWKQTVTKSMSNPE